MRLVKTGLSFLMRMTLRWQIAPAMALSTTAIVLSSKSAASILVEDDDTGQANSPRNGIQEQLLCTIFTVTTRGQLASLALLIPPVSSLGGFLSLLLGHVTDSGSAFTDPFTVGQRPCQAVIERAETLLCNERKKETIHLVL